MSIIGNRTMSVVLSRSDWQAVAPVIKTESRQKNARWTLLDVAGYGPGTVYLSLSVNGPYFRDLDNVFAVYVPGWERMEG